MNDVATTPGDALEVKLAAPPGLNIFQRMREVMREVKIVAKDRYQKFDKFHYTGHDDVTDPLHDAFVKFGIIQHVILGDMGRREDKSFYVNVTIAWINVDDPTDRFVVLSFGEAMATRDRGQKGDDLQFGKAISYAVKVAQLKNFMLVGGGIEDNEATTRPERAEREPQSEAVVAVADEQVQEFISQYRACKTRKDLEDVREAIMPLVNKRRLSEDQESRLAAADGAAEAEVQS